MKIKLIVSFIMIAGHMVIMSSQRLVTVNTWKENREFIEGFPLEIYARIFSYMAEVPIKVTETDGKKQEENVFFNMLESRKEERIKLLALCNYNCNLSKKIYNSLQNYSSIKEYMKSNQGVLTENLILKNINSFSTLEEYLRMRSLGQQPILKKDQVLSLNNALMQLPGSTYGDYTIKYKYCRSLTIANFTENEIQKPCMWGLFFFSTLLGFFNLPFFLSLLFLGVSGSWLIISMIYYRIIPKEATISVKNISKSLNDPDIVIQ